MRFRLFLLALLFAAPARADTVSPACGDPASTQLVVQVQDLRDARGEVAVTVYPDDRDRFLASKGKLARKRVAAVAPMTEVCFDLPAPGIYAVAIYHDEDADHDFDRTLVGYPDEGFGFSNNPQSTVGLPSLEEVRFEVPQGGTTIQIRTRYP